MSAQEFSGYVTAALEQDPQSGCFWLRDDFDPARDMLRFLVTTPKSQPDGDVAPFVSAFQDGEACVFAGQLDLTPRVWVTDDDGNRMIVDHIEIDGALVGYAPSAPFQPGVSYRQIHVTDVGVTRSTAQGLPGLASGTMVTTRNGDIPVDWLGTSDEVLTRDNGFQPIVWLGRTSVSSDELAQSDDLQPVCFEPGSIGPGQPHHNLVVSAGHQMLLQSPIAEMLFSNHEVFLNAAAWENGHSIQGFHPGSNMTFTHILCAEHQLILAEGAWVETVCLSAATMKGLDIKQRMHIWQALNGAAADMKKARLCLSQREAALVAAKPVADLQDHALQA